MGDSPGHPEAKDPNSKHLLLRRPCDYCGDATALLYCRADSAKLCFSCDREVHSTNQLFSKHTRSQLCDACDASPATILCSTENSVLCHNCDWERHNLSLSSAHERRTLEGFNGCPSVTELLTIVGFQDLGKKALFLGDESDGFAHDCAGPELDDEISDLLVWDTPSIVTLDDLILSTASSHTYQAMEVPPLPKNRKYDCGQYKEEILVQLRRMAKSEPISSFANEELENWNGVESLVPIQHSQPGHFCCTAFERDNVEADALFPSYEAGRFQWHNDGNEPSSQVFLSNTSLRSHVDEVPDKHSDGYGGRQSQNPINSEILSATPKIVPYDISSQERDSAISRYKEKKKSRRYDKHIRYESRKVRAESRRRIKGRFAKIDH